MQWLSAVKILLRVNVECVEFCARVRGKCDIFFAYDQDCIRYFEVAVAAQNYVCAAEKKPQTLIFFLSSKHSRLDVQTVVCAFQT